MLHLSELSAPVIVWPLFFLFCCHLLRLSFELAKLIAVETIPLFGVLGTIFCLSCFGLWLGCLNFVYSDKCHFIWRAKAWSTMWLYGLYSKYALLSFFLTRSGILAYIALSMNCWASAPKASFAVFCSEFSNSSSFVLRGQT